MSTRSRLPRRAHGWGARCTATSLRIAEGSPIARLLGTQSRTGFEVLDSAPAHSLTLVGRHRFTRHMLTFELTDAAEAATHLRARTCVVFPGARGQAYRALVIGTRAHTAAATHILRSVRRLASHRPETRPASASQPGQHHARPARALKSLTCR